MLDCPDCPDTIVFSSIRHYSSLRINFSSSCSIFNGCSQLSVMFFLSIHYKARSTVGVFSSIRHYSSLRINFSSFCSFFNGCSQLSVMFFSSIHYTAKGTVGAFSSIRHSSSLSIHYYDPRDALFFTNQFSLNGKHISFRGIC